MSLPLPLEHRAHIIHLDDQRVIDLIVHESEIPRTSDILVATADTPVILRPPFYLQGGFLHLPEWVDLDETAEALAHASSPVEVRGLSEAHFRYRFTRNRADARTFPFNPWPPFPGVYDRANELARLLGCTFIVEDTGQEFYPF